MTEFLWRVLAWIVCRDSVTAWLLRRAEANPYSTISSPDGGLYMWRGWLFNPYQEDENNRPTAPRWPWLPSVRLHHIHRADLDRHRHNHPWPKARSIILDGWYREEREHIPGVPHPSGHVATLWGADGRYCDILERGRGDTFSLDADTYHRIQRMSPGGVRTVFITWGFLGSGVWGFDVNGKHMPRRAYEAMRKEERAAPKIIPDNWPNP